MDAFLGFLTFVLFIALIVGLIKPSIILRWSKKPTRIKLFGFWILAIITIAIIDALSASADDRAKSNITSAHKHIVKGLYENAISDLKNIKKENSFYEEAQQLLKKTDSLIKITEENKLLAKEAERAKLKEDALTNQKEQLERELNSVNAGVDFSSYRETVESLQIELILFGTWARIITDGEKSENSEIQKLAKQLKPKVVKMQLKEFPILRKEYSKIVAAKLWENDIEVSVSGSGNKHINFSGGIFAANKNKQEFQKQINEVVTMFRFNQARYRWYKGADEYTYYTMYVGKDSDLYLNEK
ncbi:hypothetical protein DHD05_00340 [Arenibacter sp. N53]|uniref:hypothetical protein n=1 Tax=Arenibacter TaxID=178469 RepID=UPI000CD3D4FA|nr:MULTISPECIES: hypothetical protein [Arenibacter]MCM4150026.1 hypothetical protein [Arenibacter sp. N53]